MKQEKLNALLQSYRDKNIFSLWRYCLRDRTYFVLSWGKSGALLLEECEFTGFYIHSEPVKRDKITGESYILLSETRLYRSFFERNVSF